MVEDIGKTRIDLISDLNIENANWRVKQVMQEQDDMFEWKKYLSNTATFAIFFGIVSTVLMLFTAIWLGTFHTVGGWIVGLLLISLGAGGLTTAIKFGQQMDVDKAQEQTIVDTYSAYIKEYALQEQVASMRNRYGSAHRFEKALLDMLVHHDDDKRLQQRLDELSGKEPPDEILKLIKDLTKKEPMPEVIKAEMKLKALRKEELVNEIITTCNEVKRRFDKQEASGHMSAKDAKRGREIAEQEKEKDLRGVQEW